MFSFVFNVYIQIILYTKYIFTNNSICTHYYIYKAAPGAGGVGVGCRWHISTRQPRRAR